MEIQKLSCTDSKIEALKKINAMADAIEDGGGGQGGMGLPIGSIFQAIRLDIPEGCLRVDGSEYTTGFEEFVQNYLETEKVICKTYEEWQTEYTMTDGNVGFFGYDKETGAFKTPCIKAGTFLAQAIASGDFGSFLASSLKSHTHTQNAHTHSWSGTTSSSGAHTHTRGTQNIAGSVYLWGLAYSGSGALTGAESSKGSGLVYSDNGNATRAKISLDASKNWTGSTSSNGAHTHTVSGTTGSTTPTINATGGDDTYPKHLKYPFFVVVSNNAKQKPSQVDWDNFVGNLDSRANLSLDNLDENGQAKFDAIDNKKVNKAGDTMTGRLTINIPNNTAAIIVKGDKAIEEVPSSTYNYGYLAAYDGNNTSLGGVAVMQTSAGKVVAMLRSTYGATKQISIDSDGGTSCPTPAAGDNSTKIATTAFCVNMRCTAKATTTSSASTTRPCWVVQNYVNGHSFYRVWSDGWIEQGGRIQTTKTGTITFPKAFTSYNYKMVTNIINMSANQPKTVYLYSNTLTNITFDCRAQSGQSAAQEACTFVWYACGY